MADAAITNEIWKDIPEYEGLYQVSSLGRVRNLKGKILKPRYDRGGYVRSALSKKGKYKHVFVHVSACKAFLGPQPVEHEVNHKNNVRNDNRIENLEWVTRSQNLLHRKLFGAGVEGERNPKAILTKNKVDEIRRLLSEGRIQKKLAAIYGVSKQTISAINRRKIWN